MPDNVSLILKAAQNYCKELLTDDPETLNAIVYIADFCQLESFKGLGRDVEHYDGELSVRCVELERMCIVRTEHETQDAHGHNEGWKRTIVDWYGSYKKDLEVKSNDLLNIFHLIPFHHHYIKTLATMIYICQNSAYIHRSDDPKIKEFQEHAQKRATYLNELRHKDYLEELLPYLQGFIEFRRTKLEGSVIK
jgi:hypothetical protein